MNITDEVACYSRAPLHSSDGIPVFSETDAYVRNYERISADHLNHFEATGHNPFMSESHWREVEDSTAALLRQHVPSGAKLLDVGVGMGRLLERFPQHRRFGMDISLRYLKYAQDKGIEVCMARIEDMPYKLGFFDACVCTDVLEHVLDLNDAVRRILATLREDGLLIVRVPYREDLSPYLADGFPYDMVHLRNFDEGSLRLFFEKILSLEVLQLSYAGHAEGRSGLEAGLPLLGAVWRRMVRLSRVLGTRAHAAACRRFLQPVEINVVVRNRRQPA